MGYEAKIVLDSVTPNESRLTTMAVTFPRFILAEFNTHRVFSRNSASSRAIPTQKIIERIRADPVYPLEWGTNKPGMQAGDELSSDNKVIAVAEWENAYMEALDRAQALASLGVHKQVVNRILEPFMWHTVIVSSTAWNNFFDQRCHRDAQPEIRHIAEMMREALWDSDPQSLSYGEWHLPYIQDDEKELGLYLKRELSVARCARVSYLGHDGKRAAAKDLELFNKLMEGWHLSPFEHVAAATECPNGMNGNFDPAWTQYRKLVEW